MKIIATKIITSICPNEGQTIAQQSDSLILIEKGYVHSHLFSKLKEIPQVYYVYKHIDYTHIHKLLELEP